MNDKKKKVAVFLNGWNNENTCRFLTGLQEHSEESSADYYVFVSHAIYSYTEIEIKSMCTIFDLPDLTGFDAAILFTPGLNFTDVINQLIIKLERSGIPVISIGLRHPGFYYVGINNYTGMRQLCDHLIEMHNVRDITFIAGSRENEDSNTRLQALTDSAMAHGVPFGEENIFYSDWEVSPVTEEFEKRFKSGAKLSDAYICANDQLAETVSYAMTDCGYEPDAAIITGFDFQQEGQNFYPSLASVDQCYDIVGERSAELLYHIFRGEAVEEELLVDCVFHPGESCGCLDSRSDDVHRRTVARGIPRHFSMNEFVDQRFQSMEREIVQAADYDDMKERLTRLFRSPGLEGDTFYIMMDPHVVDFSLGGISDHPQYQYADLMDTIVAKRDGNLISAGVIPTALLLPDADATDSVNHLYFFVPIYFESYVCGYIVMTDRPDWLREWYFHVCESRFNGALISYCRNMQLTALNTKLSMLMEKDSLTFVKNRTAYDRYVKKLDSQMAGGEAEPFAVICFDLNNLKSVNDELGHEAGDEYIKKCCKLICNTYKHSPVFRIGGDEFVAIAVHDDYLHRFELLKEMRDHMEALRTDPHKRMIDRISVASGLSDCCEHVGDDYSAIFRRADTRMYENKKVMKAER